MPKRRDIEKILVIGSGPIVIGQACEFDYSGTQALQALREEGYKVVLVNSNPATIMTDPEFSDHVYIEPLTVDFVTRVIEAEKPQAILPTMGGQTALNLALALHDNGILAKHGIELLGARPDVIRRAEDRELFKATMDAIGVASARSILARCLEDGKRILKDIGLPLILRPSFTLGGEGGGVAHTEEEFLSKLDQALYLSPTHEVLIEESLIGWKEFELEVVRDRNDNVIIVCSIENFDPMGVHTGDSITVAPAQTLTDREYQNLRDQSIRIIRAIGVETGGSNIQFAIHPTDGRVIVIEMNPRVSRSSALASKATGFPIARVAAKLAVGYTLNELTNDITGTTPSSFEPSIDYVVTKIPRFDFEKFEPSEPILGTQMKSVGEVMAIGRTFEESFAKALAGLEIGPGWLAPLENTGPQIRWEQIENSHARRFMAIGDALRKGATPTEIAKRSGIDRWFLDRLKLYLDAENVLLDSPWPLPKETFQRIKERGWTDRAIAQILKKEETEVRSVRESLGIHGQFHCVDTCAAEFEAKTPYLYSSYSGSDESRISTRNKVLVLGGGPNRIGQGIEFDYCCVHAALALQEIGIETVMVNSNPETVSTDFNISDRLYFEPLTAEHVLNIARVEKPLGVLVQFGGQTPLKLARALEAGGLKILGTSADAIDLAEDRRRFGEVVASLAHLGLKQPEARTASTRSQAVQFAEELGFPVLVRPSYVLGGRGMRVVRNRENLELVVDRALELSGNHPLLIDRFLVDAIEVDVDAVSDGKDTLIGGLMEHIEEAGIHSGDSACSLPTVSLSKSLTDRLRLYTREIAKRLKVIGLINIQFAIKDDDIYVLEVNPRASRTVPFVSKAVRHPLAKIATKVMMGRSLHNLGLHEDLDLGLKTFSVKAPVFPFARFPKVDILLGPEMKSTGEVMGRAATFPAAYAKALAGSGMTLPTKGNVFFSVRDEDKEEAVGLARALQAHGFEVWATHGTAEFLKARDIKVHRINKVLEGSPHCVDAIMDRKFDLVINTTSDEQAIRDSFSVRRATLERKVPYATVMASAIAMVKSIGEDHVFTNQVERL